MSNYFVSKDKKTGEIIYIEYDHNGYNVSPKVQKKDSIEVDKIVFVSNDLTKKLLKKKIDVKLNKLLKELSTVYEDDDDDTTGDRIRKSLVEAERLKLNIINEYRKYIGSDYASLTLEKIEIILNGFRSKLYRIREKEQSRFLEQFMKMNLDNDEELNKQANKGKRGR